MHRCCSLWPVLLAALSGCGPAAPDEPAGSTSTSTSSTEPTTAPTSDATGTSTTQGPQGCPGAEDPAANDECAVHRDAASCPTSCRWFPSLLFPGCDGQCSEAVPSGVCVTVSGAPETGCTGPCAKFWLETPEGLQLFEADLCFEFPDAWPWCQLDGRPECACGCVTPP